MKFIVCVCVRVRACVCVVCVSHTLNIFQNSLCIFLKKWIFLCERFREYSFEISEILVSGIFYLPDEKALNTG